MKIKCFQLEKPKKNMKNPGKQSKRKKKGRREGKSRQSSSPQQA